MADFLLMIVFLSALLSLASYLYCWGDIKTGSPHIISLRQITGVMDRARLNRMFGSPKRGWRYRLSPGQLKALVEAQQAFFRQEIAADALCMLGSYYYMGREIATPALWWFIALAAACQGVNIAWSVAQLRKWGRQIREELEDSEE